jgi:dihydrofolate reductase
MARTGQIERLTSIVAIDENGAIGCKNSLPWSLKSDMAFFRRQTIGNSIIMGRKTYDSIGGCLPGRTNIVLSHNDILFQGTENCQLALSVSEALYRAARSQKPEAYVVGGAQTYSQFAQFIERYLVTVVKHRASDADAHLSSEIISDFATWERKLIASYPATEGRDQFAFDVFEILPPDTASRRERIEEHISGFESCLGKKSSKPKSVSSSFTGSQEAFSF